MAETKVSDAKIGQMKVEEEKEVDWEELVKLPDTEQYRIMDARLTNEIVDQMRGHFTEELVYNIPRTGGSKNTHPECDRMKGGCTYKGKSNHIHILGIGYQGALTAMRAYGQLKAYIQERPEVVEEAEKLYWAAYAEVTDGHNGNALGRWYLETVLLTTKRGVIEKEFASSVAQSKALRNCILGLIPRDLINAWLEDYRKGKKPFDPGRTKEMGYNKQTAPAAQTPKRRTKKQPESNGKPSQMDEFMAQLASKKDLNLEIVSAWIEMRDETPARNTLFLNRCINDDNVWAESEPDYRKFEEKFLRDQKDAKDAEDLFDKKEE
jgi:hypothetical protein